MLVIDMKRLLNKDRQIPKNASWAMVTAIALLLVFLVDTGHGRIPEPDNIVYGIMPDGNSTISLKTGDQEFVTYTMGDNPNAGDYFVLRVPIDAVDPQDTGSLRPGDTCELFLDAETTAVASVKIGMRGTIQRIYLPGTPPPQNDADEDGVPDEEDNCENTHNPDQNDANANGVGDACDNSDTDGDGYTDMLEYAYFMSGRLDLDGNAYNPLVPNPPGDAGYLDPHDKSRFWLLMLPAILNGGYSGADIPLRFQEDDDGF